MKVARQSDAVSWWKMGRNAVARYGFVTATEMATDLKEGSAAQSLFLSGVRGEPRPEVRPSPSPRKHKEISRR